MPSKYLRDDDRLIRYVPWGKLRKDPDDEEKVVGVLYSAFTLRDDEPFLSATWCEYFDGPAGDALACAVQAVRNSTLKVSPKGHFAVATTKAVADHMASGNCKLRIVHEAEEDNPAHVAVRKWQDDNTDLLSRLADDIWCELYSNKELVAPQDACSVSEFGASES